MDIIKAAKEQRQRDKEEAIKAFEESKNYTKESFSKEHREKVLESNIDRLTSSEMKEFNKTQYTTHMKLLLAGIPVFAIGMIFPPLLLVAMGLFAGGLICMIKNWKIINKEHKTRMKIQAVKREEFIKNK